MSSTQQTSALPSAQPLGGEPEPDAQARARRRGRLLGRVRPQHIALTAVLALSAVLNVNHLSRNGYANTFYSAAVRSMLRSWHNFFFVSFDPGGMVTVDKPPLGLWVQGLSAELFGFHPLSLLLPEAIAGVLAVGALYWVVTPRFGPAAGVMSALALAVFPSFVAVSRDNNLDALLILLMILACGVGLRAIGSGRLLSLLGCAALVGLAFNTKTLAAYLVVPGLALGYLVCAPGSFARRAAQLLAAGVVLLLVSASWSLVVELTPASQRPFVGGSIDNTEHDLTFGYNGFGRVEGQVGGPGRIPVVFKHGSLAHIEREALRTHGHASTTAALAPAAGATPSAHPVSPGTRAGTAPAAKKAAPLSKYLPNGRLRYPVAFGGPTGPLRLFEEGLGGQAGWMLPFALLGLIALALWSIGSPPPADDDRLQAGDGELGAGDGRLSADGDRSRAGDNGLERGGGRRDPRLAGLIVLGSWFLVEATVLSLSKGIVHPYYLSALGPGTAAMVGGGAVAFVAPGARRRPAPRADSDRGRGRGRGAADAARLRPLHALVQAGADRRLRGRRRGGPGAATLHPPGDGTHARPAAARPRRLCRHDLAVLRRGDVPGRRSARRGGGRPIRIEPHGHARHPSAARLCRRPPAGHALERADRGIGHGRADDPARSRRGRDGRLQRQ